MAKQPSRVPDSIPTTSPAHRSTGAFVLGSDKQLGMATGKALRAYDGLFAAIGSRDRYQNYDTNTSVRNQFTRTDYEFFRPNEAIPHKSEEIILACRNAYRRVGIIRNVMDLMADFGCQGARLVHPNPRIQKFFRGWWKKAQGGRVCERFLNLYYREGIAVLKRTMGRLPQMDERRLRAMGADGKLEADVEPDKPLRVPKRVIPLRYNFLNPLRLKPLGEELSKFVGKEAYAIKVSWKLRNSINNPRNAAERRLVEMLPKDIREAVQRGDTEIPLDPDKVQAFHYKKDDWQTWADPMTYAIMDDIILLEKMKLADLAALDGAISQVRIWKLGHINDAHPDMSIFPTDVAIDRLSEILLSNPGGGAFDIIWGPELSVEEYKTNVHQFLGEEKYKPVWNSIYAGLGVPPTLTGAATASGFTNNFISLKTLVQRLEYGRDALRMFWEQEIELVRQAMGFQKGAKLVFDNMVLADEAAEKALLIQLADRDVISVETLIERFGELPEFEEIKARHEERRRKQKLMKPKAGPFHTPEKMFEYIKLALQRGYIAPEQTGMTEDFPEEFLDVESPFEMQLKSAEKTASMKTGPTTQQSKTGKSGQGRPKNSKDSGKRDTRTPKPAGASATAAYITSMMWARNAQAQISEIVTPVILKHYGKKSLRALSSEQVKKVEQVKFAVLCHTPVYGNVTAESVRGILQNGRPVPAQYEQMYDALYGKVVAKSKTEPSVEETRMIQVTTYAALNCDEEQIYQS